MAKIKIKFRASSVESKEGTLYYQITHNCVTRQIHTGYKLYPAEWDAVHSKIDPTAATNAQRREYLLSLQVELEADRKKMSTVTAYLGRNLQDFTTDQIVEHYRKSKTVLGIGSYAAELNTKLREVGKSCMANRYATTVNSLLRYLNGRDISLYEVSSTLMQGYEQWLKEHGLCRNTSSFYMRNLRAIYNHAVEDGLVIPSGPFKHVYTGIDKTIKRALPLATIKQLKNLDLSQNPHMEFARDMFLFSFYTRGMSFIDMAHLTKSNLHGGVLTYRRQKTAQQLCIKWEEPMQEIASRYFSAASPYLLPIAYGKSATFRRNYKNTYCRVTTQLKKLGKMLNLPIPLTTYVARHSWASIAKSQNVATSTISEALGHDSEATTMIYLSSLDTSIVDKANRLIINSLVRY